MSLNDDVHIGICENDFLVLSDVISQETLFAAICFPHNPSIVSLVVLFPYPSTSMCNYFLAILLCSLRCQLMYPKLVELNLGRRSDAASLSGSPITNGSIFCKNSVAS